MSNNYIVFYSHEGHSQSFATSFQAFDSLDEAIEYYNKALINRTILHGFNHGIAKVIGHSTLNANFVSLIDGSE